MGRSLNPSLIVGASGAAASLAALAVAPSQGLSITASCIGAALIGALTVVVTTYVASQQKALAESAARQRRLEWEFAATRHSNRIGIATWEGPRQSLRPDSDFAALFGFDSSSSIPDEETLLQRVRQEDREWARMRWDSIRTGSMVPPQVLVVRLPDGKERAVRLDASFPPGDNGAPLEVARDISQRRATARALFESHTHLTELIRAIPGAVFHLRQVSSGHFNLSFVSEGARSLFDIPAEVSPQDLDQLLIRFSPAAVREFLGSLERSAAALTAWSHDAQLTTRNGHVRWVRFSGSPSTQGNTVSWNSVVTDITAEKLSEQKLRFTQFAMDHARDAITVVDRDGRRLYANQESSRLTGYSFSELMTGTVYDVMPDVNPTRYAGLWELLEKQRNHVFEAALRTKSGEPRQIEVSASFIEYQDREALFVVTRDITARKAAEAALREIEGRMRMTQYALDHAQDLISIMGPNGDRLYVNEAFCRFTGYDLSELNQRPVWDGLPQLGEEGYRQLWQRIKQAGALTFEIDLQTKSGEARPIEANCSFLVVDGIEAICTVSRDLAPRRAADRERQLMEQQLRETQKLESLGVLAGGIAHDFNNLLTGILGNASLARDRLPEGDSLHGPLQQVETAAVRAGELCQQMLAYAGKGRVIVGPVDLSSLVEETAHLLQVSVAHRATLDLRLAKRLPRVQADATQIRQIVMNLVINAAEAINRPDGKITITTGLLTVTPEFLASARVAAGLEPGECVYLEVRDNGAGMSPATLERIFEPFFTTKFTGRGLGLAAVLGIVRSHQGALNVSSELGAGTAFQLVLSPESKRRRSRAPSEKQTSSPFRLQGRILVVDDEDSVRSVTVQALERSGFEVDSAENGDTAIQLLHSTPSPYHAVLLDFTMPPPDGGAVLRAIRTMKHHIPVIMMSGFSEEETRRRLDDLPIEGFLAKPFNLPHLRAKVDAVVRDSLARARQAQLDL